MKLIFYMYYRYYRLIKPMSFDGSYIHGRIVGIFCASTACNIVWLLSVSGINSQLAPYVIVGAALAWFFFWLVYLTRSSRLKEAVEKFERETTLHSYIGGLGIILYTSASFFSMLHELSN